MHKAEVAQAVQAVEGRGTVAEYDPGMEATGLRWWVALPMYLMQRRVVGKRRRN
jgi:hypothetical protein